jgi:hypothetical protein
MLWSSSNQTRPRLDRPLYPRASCICTSWAQAEESWCSTQNMSQDREGVVGSRLGDGAIEGTRWLLDSCDGVIKGAATTPGRCAAVLDARARLVGRDQLEVRPHGWPLNYLEVNSPCRFSEPLCGSSVVVRYQRDLLLAGEEQDHHVVELPKRTSLHYHIHQRRGWDDHVECRHSQLEVRPHGQLLS